MAVVTRAPDEAAAAGQFCPVCGQQSEWGPEWPLADELIEAWELSPRWRTLFERREGLACQSCNCCSRYRHFATVLLDELGARSAGFDNLADYARSDHFRQLDVAEINRCGALHDILDLHPGLHYSDHGSTDPAVPSEDLLDLSYDNEQFDLVITTDTLEHLPDLSQALGEIERVLKPGGRHIFTVPAVWDGRTTRQRAVMRDGQIVHLHPASYHGTSSAKQSDRLVFHEFGNDVLDYLETAGTETRTDSLRNNQAVCIFVTVKTPVT